MSATALAAAAGIQLAGMIGHAVLPGLGEERTVTYANIGAYTESIKVNQSAIDSYDQNIALALDITALTSSESLFNTFKATIGQNIKSFDTKLQWSAIQDGGFRLAGGIGLYGRTGVVNNLDTKGFGISAGIRALYEANTSSSKLSNWNPLNSTVPMMYYVDYSTALTGQPKGASIDSVTLAVGLRF